MTWAVDLAGRQTASMAAAGRQTIARAGRGVGVRVRERGVGIRCGQAREIALRAVQGDDDGGGSRGAAKSAGWHRARGAQAYRAAAGPGPEWCV